VARAVRRNSLVKDITTRIAPCKRLASWPRDVDDCGEDTNNDEVDLAGEPQGRRRSFVLLTRLMLDVLIAGNDKVKNAQATQLK